MNKYRRRSRFSFFLALVLVLALTLTAFSGVRVRAEEGIKDVDHLFDFIESRLENTPMKNGYELDFKVRLNGVDAQIPAEYVQAIHELQGILKLGADLEDPEKPAVNLNLGLYNVNKPDTVLSVIAYNAGDQVFLNAPGILPKPLMITAEALEQMTSGATGSVPSVSSMMHESLALNKLGVADLRAYYQTVKAAFIAVEETTETVTVGEISEELAVLKEMIPSAEVPALLTKLLNQFKEAPSTKAMLEYQKKFQPEPEEGTEPLEQLAAGIEQTIENIQSNPAGFSTDVSLTSYKDAEGNLSGFSLQAGEEGTEVQVELLDVKSADQHAVRFLLNTPQSGTVEGLGSYVIENGDSYTGDFSLKAAEQEIGVLRFEGLKNIPTDDENVNYLDGRLELTLYTTALANAVPETGMGSESGTTDADLNAELESVAESAAAEAEEILESASEQLESAAEAAESGATEAVPSENGEPVETEEQEPMPLPAQGTDIRIVYEGRMEGEKHHVELTLIPDIKLESSHISLILDERYIPASEYQTVAEVPAEYIDMTDDEQMNLLFQDSTLLQNLMTTLTEMGLGFIFQAQQ